MGGACPEVGGACPKPVGGVCPGWYMYICPEVGGGPKLVSPDEPVTPPPVSCPPVGGGGRFCPPLDKGWGGYLCPLYIC